MRKYIISLMKNGSGGFPDVVIKGILLFLSWIYALAVRLVNLAYRFGIRRSHKVDAVVISVGNITSGGTGKTPFTIYLAEYFSLKGRKCAVLMRGYGKDENRMLDEELPDVAVLAGQDRVKNARLAVSYGKEIIILDDGFQHRRLARDLNILLLDSRRPFGNGFLVPRGMLREGLCALKRADIFVLTKTDLLSAVEKEKLLSRIKGLAGERPVILARHKGVFLSDTEGREYPVGSMSGENVLLVSGIADPDYFAHVVEGGKPNIVARIEYLDHHKYSQKDVNRIAAVSSEKGAGKILTTGKDYVKLKKLDISSIEEKLFILHIGMEIVENREALLAGLNSGAFNQAA